MEEDGLTVSPFVSIGAVGAGSGPTFTVSLGGASLVVVATVTFSLSLSSAALCEAVGSAGCDGSSAFSMTSPHTKHVMSTSHCSVFSDVRLSVIVRLALLVSETLSFASKFDFVAKLSPFAFARLLGRPFFLCLSHASRIARCSRQWACSHSEQCEHWIRSSSGFMGCLSTQYLLSAYGMVSK
jgi:hypothetical protein